MAAARKRNPKPSTSGPYPHGLVCERYKSFRLNTRTSPNPLLPCSHDMPHFEEVRALTCNINSVGPTNQALWSDQDSPGVAIFPARLNSKSRSNIGTNLLISSIAMFRPMHVRVPIPNYSCQQSVTVCDLIMSTYGHPVLVHKPQALGIAVKPSLWPE